MLEITKLYENAEIRKEEIVNCTYKGFTPCGHYCDDGLDCPYLEIKKDYPPFTAEKQIELIKLIANSKGYPDYEYFGKLFDDYIQLLKFDEALAQLANSLWQDLTEEEKQQIKEILE